MIFKEFKWWPGTESNRRRQPFQGCALPTELPGHSHAMDWSDSQRRTIPAAGSRMRAGLADYNEPPAFHSNLLEQI